MSKLFWIGIGGFLGANCRYLLGLWADNRWGGSSLPAGTLLVNVAGSFLLGLAITLLTERALGNPAWRFFLAVGFLGSYTTFSTFSFETFKLLEEGSWWLGAFNAGLSLLLGLIGVGLGVALARWL